MTPLKLRRYITRPNGRKAINRLCTDIGMLIALAPMGTPVGHLLRGQRKLADLRDILEVIYREIK